MAVQIQGGPALNVAVDSAGTNAQRTGGPAIPVAVVTDGRAVQAGPARRLRCRSRLASACRGELR